MHCHHEKLVVVDDEVAFVGGIDITSMGGDRWDTPDHPARGRLGWHDVASRLRGPAVADVAAHLSARWSAVTGEPSAAPLPPAPAGDLEVQVVRTLPERLYDFAPQGDFRILEAYRRALRSARRLVYLENQFLWAPEIVEILAARLREPPSDDFRVIVLLPGRANNGEDDTRGQVAVLADADQQGGGGRFLATTIVARTGRTSDRVYVHAKVGIVDDRWLTLGSANLNAHSLYNDTEMNVVLCDRGARTCHARAPVGLAPGVLGRRGGRRPGARVRRALGPDRRRAARTARPRRAADAPPARAAPRLAAGRPPARPASGAGGRRVSGSSPRTSG